MICQNSLLFCYLANKTTQLNVNKDYSFQGKKKVLPNRLTHLFIG